MAAQPDRWSRWHRERRGVGAPDQSAPVSEHLRRVRDEILERSEPLDAATLLDLGSGDGLIGLAALDRVGPGGSVIFCDISGALLDQCREAVHDRSLTGRARFVNTHAENLAGIADNSVDVVTTRAVLIFVTDKPAAFTAIHRVLRPGGRMTLREPVGSLMFPEADDASGATPSPPRPRSLLKSKLRSPTSKIPYTGTR